MKSPATGSSTWKEELRVVERDRRAAREILRELDVVGLVWLGQLGARERERTEDA